MQPQAVAARDVGDLAERVERRGRRAPDNGGDGAGSQARREILLDQLSQRVRPHSLGFVERNHPDVLAPEAGKKRALLDA